MVDAGDTVTLEPLKLPGFQVKLPAPVALKVLVLPAQIVAGLAAGTTVGVGFTNKVTNACEVHVPAVPVTVYVVELFGLTVTVDPLKLPGFHV